MEQFLNERESHANAIHPRIMSQLIIFTLCHRPRQACSMHMVGIMPFFMLLLPGGVRTSEAGAKKLNSSHLQATLLDDGYG